VEQHNKWVDNLLNLYIGKIDAIGLDSEFARATYIETLLDKELIPAIIQGQYAVVFLTGNPGDGKAAQEFEAFATSLYGSLTLARSSVDGGAIKTRLIHPTSSFEQKV